jgi:acetyl-CoA acetyltransferase
MNSSPGMSPCGVNDVQDALRLKFNWYSGGPEVPAQLVDTVQLCDGFSFLTITWLEALGLFPKGEAGPWLEGGESRIGLGGQIPLNTNGGQLSGGRLHGYGYLYEACAQLRGEATGRQVEGAQVAVVAAGGGCRGPGPGVAMQRFRRLQWLSGQPQKPT